MKTKHFSILIAALFLAIPTVFCGNSLSISNKYANLVKSDIFADEVTSSGFDLTECNIKYAHDCNDNPYIIGEQDNGYFIYNCDLNIIVEYSHSSLSPYTGVNANLIYGGPTYYFVENNSEYISLLDKNEKYNISKVSKIDAYNSSVNTYSTNTLSDSEIDSCVQHPNFFSIDCYNNCGFFYTDRCGFIGLGLLIAYHDRYHNDKFMDNKFYGIESTRSDGLKGYSSSIGQYLYDLHPKDSTTSMHIKETMNIYAEERGLNIDYYSRWTPFYSNVTIRNAIFKDIPVELFGNFKYGDNQSTGDHAMVAYGAIFDNRYYWRCHLGWRTYSDVIITGGVIGSVYYFYEK